MASNIFDLSGLHAVVSGAGRGLGQASAFALAEAGATVWAMARTASQINETCDEIRSNGGQAKPIVCDVTSTEQLADAFKQISQVDILLNNAGTNIPEPFVDVSEDHFDAIMGLNVKATFQVAQAAVRKMLNQGRGGSIINVSSQMGHVGAPNRSVYCMSKHAVEGLTKAMAVELGPNKIRVNAIGPTFVETELTRNFFSDPVFLESVLTSIPIGRLGQVDDITGAVVFLASPAASLITGSSLVIDGGWTAR